MEKLPKITGTRYVLAVKNLQKSAEFYQNQLGFRSVWSGEGWHFVERGKCFIMMGECADEMPASELGDHSYFAYLEVDSVDALYEEFKEKEVKIRTVPHDQPWGQREFAIQTIDGHRIMFGEEITR